MPWSNIYKIQACSSQAFPSGLPLKERRRGTNWFGQNTNLLESSPSLRNKLQWKHFWRDEVCFSLLISSWANIRTAETPGNCCFQNIFTFPHLKEKMQKFSFRKLFSRRLCQTCPGNTQHARSSGKYSNSSVFISTHKATQSAGRVRNLHSLKHNLYHTGWWHNHHAFTVQLTAIKPRWKP